VAFPTTPTVAGNTLLSSTTSPASTTHTFPSLTTLAPQAGDLLIAICLLYTGSTGGSAGDQFSAWGGSFNELADLETTTALDVAIGIATKTAVGGETGTFTVTSATSVKSVQFLMRIPAGTWKAIENSAATRSVGGVPDPASFDPAGWAAEDTLWIAVYGHSETTTTGSPPTIDTAPTNFTGASIVARVADAVGDITAAVAFRAQNASAQDVGTWTVSNPTRGNGAAVVLAIRPVNVQTTSFDQDISPTIDTAVKAAHVVSFDQNISPVIDTAAIRSAFAAFDQNISPVIDTAAIRSALAAFDLDISPLISVDASSSAGASGNQQFAAFALDISALIDTQASAAHVVTFDRDLSPLIDTAALAAHVASVTTPLDPLIDTQVKATHFGIWAVDLSPMIDTQVRATHFGSVTTPLDPVVDTAALRRALAAWALDLGFDISTSAARQQFAAWALSLDPAIVTQVVARHYVAFALDLSPVIFTHATRNPADGGGGGTQIYRTLLGVG